MKSTGIIRAVDGVGRVVLPKELRKLFDIDEEGSQLEIFIEEDKIVLKKYSPACIFCNSSEDVVSFQGKCVCKNCIQEINKLPQP